MLLHYNTKAFNNANNRSEFLLKSLSFKTLHCKYLLTAFRSCKWLGDHSEQRHKNNSREVKLWGQLTKILRILNEQFKSESVLGHTAQSVLSLTRLSLSSSAESQWCHVTLLRQFSSRLSAHKQIKLVLMAFHLKKI